MQVGQLTGDVCKPKASAPWITHGEPAPKGPTVLGSHQVFRQHYSMGDPLKGNGTSNSQLQAVETQILASQLTLYLSYRDDI